MVKIENYIYGCMTINGKDYKEDIMITPDGAIAKRHSELSKNELEISEEEIALLIDKGAEVIIIGTGKQDSADVTETAQKLCKKNDITLEIRSTPTAANRFNWWFGKKKVAGIFHLTD